MLGFMPRLRFALRELFGCPPEAPEHGVRQHARGEYAERHQRQNDRQQHLTRPPRRPTQIADGYAVIADKGFGDDAVAFGHLWRQRQIGQ